MRPYEAVSCGIDNKPALVKALRGKRLGLITGPAGVDRRLRPMASILTEEFNVIRLFAPEHGFRGEVQAGGTVENYTDAETGLTVHSLYADDRGQLIPAGLLKDLDAIVYDMQDIGARFFTFLYTLTDAMTACAEAGTEIVVLDRVNPVGLTKIEGSVLDERFASFVGRYALPTRYALTSGEFAGYINIEKHINCGLSVVPCLNYSRGTRFEETGLCWVLPSPNMPSAAAALAYIGTCLFEGTNLSEGRGTVKPFEMIGAPWLNAKRVIEYVKPPDGALFNAVFFRPWFSKHKGELCEGVQLHITDADAFEPFRTGLRLLQAIRETHPAFAFQPAGQDAERPFITYLMGGDAILKDGFDADAFIASQAEALADYRRRAEGYYLYD